MYDFKKEGNELTFTLPGYPYEIGRQIRVAEDFLLAEYSIFLADCINNNKRLTKAYITIIDQNLDAYKPQVSNDLIVKWSVLLSILQKAADNSKNLGVYPLCCDVPRESRKLLVNDENYLKSFGRLSDCKTADEVLAICPVELLTKRYIKRFETMTEDGTKCGVWGVSRYLIKRTF